MEITHNGRFLFTVNTASGSVSRYVIAPPWHAEAARQYPDPRTTSVGAVDARLSPDGRFLYVDESKTAAVAAFAVHGGHLTELASSPASLPAGATPAGIVVT